MHILHVQDVMPPPGKIRVLGLSPPPGIENVKIFRIAQSPYIELFQRREGQSVGILRLHPNWRKWQKSTKISSCKRSVMSSEYEAQGSGYLDSI